MALRIVYPHPWIALALCFHDIRIKSGADQIIRKNTLVGVKLRQIEFLGQTHPDNAV